MKNRVRLWALLAGPAVTLTLGFGWTFDQVNTIKLFTLSFIAGLAAAEIILLSRKLPKLLFSPAFIVSKVFLLALLVPMVLSNSPIAQQIYGTSGRNLGFLHYFFLTLVFLGFSALNARVIWPKILKSLVLLGTFEAVYSCFQLVGLDILPWVNPDKWIFGTFGNPNYLSSFLALSVISTAYVAVVEAKFAVRILWLSIALFQIGVILFSGSSQGLILVSFGLFVILVILLSRRSKIIGWIFFALGSLAALIATLGIFQYGPLTKFLYQDSISYRGDYWRAGIRMFSDNWIYGVGLDSYGDYYRMYRDSTAANRRGLDIFSNSAHNLFIDFAATGGIFLLAAYLLILGLVSFSIFKAFIRKVKLELEYKVLVTLWLAFNLQTLISINVPALAVWGWIFSGLILAYNNEGKYIENLGLRNKRKVRIIVSSVCCAFCLAVVSPLIIRDVKLNTALSKNDIQEISRAVLSFPKDASQIAQVANAFDKADLGKESLKLAKQAVVENPNSSQAWKIILDNPDANLQDEESAREALRRLDPLNKPR